MIYYVDWLRVTLEVERFLARESSQKQERLRKMVSIEPVLQCWNTSVL